MPQLGYATAGSSNSVMGVTEDPALTSVNAKLEFSEIDEDTVLCHLSNSTKR